MNNVNGDAAPRQHPVRYTRLNSSDVMHLYIYHPWGDGKSPKIDHITHTIINFKKGETSPVNYFKKVIPNSFPKGGSHVYCFVPSHKKKTQSSAMQSLLLEIKSHFGFTNTVNYLQRTKTVDKATSGGERSLKVHKDSISVTEPESVKGKKVILFDDVTTTGYSLQACKDLLLEAGASEVYMIALSKTAGD